MFQIREWLVPVLWKKSKSKICRFQLFPTLKRTPDFYERTSKETVFWLIIWFKNKIKWEPWLYIKTNNLIFLRFMVMNCKTTQVTTRVCSFFLITAQHWYTVNQSWEGNLLCHGISTSIYKLNVHSTSLVKHFCYSFNYPFWLVNILNLFYLYSAHLVYIWGLPLPWEG
jgi:hypothetical protein